MKSRTPFLLLAAALLVPIPAGVRAAEPAPRKPNVLIVISDDESWLECSIYGRASIPTPQFDRVAAAGVLFRHAYCSAPSCAPARAALLTGRNFWELDQGAFIQAWLPAQFATLPELLAKAGYHAGYTGKCWGPGVKDPTGRRDDPGGTAWSRVRLKSPPDGISNIDYAANFAEFLDAKPADKPFYFWAGLLEPHHPHGAENYRKLGAGLDTIRVPGFLPDTPGVRREYANYLYEVRYADDTLGVLLRELEKRGELDNTLVIVTGDNGSPFPRAKCNVHDWGVHVPLAVMWPARVPAGRTVDDFVGFPDLAPTILDAAGLSVPADMSGRSALNVLTATTGGRIDPSRDFTVNGLEWHGNLPPIDLAARMIRVDRFEYIVNYSSTRRLSVTDRSRKPDDEYEQDAETMRASSLVAAHPDHPKVKPFTAMILAPRPHEELYDCEADPDQQVNLADRPAYAETLARLRDRLEEVQRRTKDPRITGDMAVFRETLKFVEHRKAAGYEDAHRPAKEGATNEKANEP